MFDFKSVTMLLDDLKEALPGIKQAVPGIVDRVERLESEMLRIGNENNKLLGQVLIELRRSNDNGR